MPIVTAARARMVALLVLVLALVAAPVQAAQTGVIMAKVLVPDGARDVSLRLYSYDAARGQWRVFREISRGSTQRRSFAISAVPVGVGILVEVEEPWPGGFWAGNGKPLVTFPEQAEPVRAGAPEIVLEVDEGQDSRNVLRLVSTMSYFRTGYHSEKAGGLTGLLEHATVVTPGQRPRVVVSPRLLLPVVQNRTAPTVSGRATYTPGVADAGKRLAVRVTASKDTFAAGAATSAEKAPVALAPAPRAVTPPKVTGTARLGSTLKATSGTWAPFEGTGYAFQWLRGGKAIKGATGSTYTLTTADVGKKVSVRVTATLAGRHPGVATSSAKKVAKGRPTVTASAKRAKGGTRPKVTVKVKASGLVGPKGTVTVRYGTRAAKATLKASAKGKVTVRLPQLKKGRHTLRVSYEPTGSSARYLTSATAGRIVLRVS